MIRTPDELDEALRAAEDAIRKQWMEQGYYANPVSLAYAALRAAIPILDRRAA